MTDEEITTYSAGPVSRKLAGRKRKYNQEAKVALTDLRLRYPIAKFSKLQSIFSQYYDCETVFSKATLTRVFAAAEITRKVREVRNMHANPQQQYEYLISIAPVDPMNLVDVDETLSTAEEFLQKYGWSPSGEPAYYQQIRINGRAYSTIAAYTPMGFLCWSIYEGSITSVEVVHFITTKLTACLSSSSFVIIDNATIHKITESMEGLEKVTAGRFKYSPQYSPELKPIELGFGSIKRWIREHEADAVSDPISWIDRAFELFSTLGEQSSAGNTVCILYCMVMYCFNFILCVYCHSMGALERVHGKSWRVESRKTSWSR